MLIKKLLEQWQDKDKYDGPERREFARLVYPPDQRPKLTVRECVLEVLDISEGGMKLLNYMQRKLGRQIFGTVVLLSGKSMDISGKIEWQYNNEFGLLITRIPRSVIIEEIQTLLKEKGQNKSTQES